MAPRYTTIEAVKATLRTPNVRNAPSYDSGGDYDLLLFQDIEAAEAAIDAYCDTTFDGYTGRAATRVYPVQRSTMVMTDDYASKPVSVEGSKSGVFDAEVWHPLVYPAKQPGFGIMLRYGRFRQFETVEVNAVWGWAQVPAEVIKAATLYSARLFSRSNAPLGLQMSDVGGAYIQRSDPDIAALLAPYKNRQI